MCITQRICLTVNERNFAPFFQIDDIYAFQSATTRERIIADCCYGIRYSNTYNSATLIERLIADSSYRLSLIRRRYYKACIWTISYTGQCIAFFIGIKSIFQILRNIIATASGTFIFAIPNMFNHWNKNFLSACFASAYRAIMHRIVRAFLGAGGVYDIFFDFFAFFMS